MLLLKATRLIDGDGNAIRDAAVLVDGERIRQVGLAGRMEAPPDAEVIDLADCTLMPGLIDCHIHLMAQNAVTFRDYRVATFEVTPQLQQMCALLHAQMCLEMGYTTLRDLAWLGYTGTQAAEMVAVRDAINNGIFAGPRILVAGRATITNSDFDHILPGNLPRPAGGCGDGPWELRRLVRSSLRIGCDLIKTTASGGGGTDKEPPDIRNMTQEELDAIVEEAHYFHKPVACHAFTAESQKRCVRAGVDTLEHAVFTDDEALAMIQAESKIVVPTLAHRGDHAIEVRRRGGTPVEVLQKMKRIQPYCTETFKRLHQAGVKLAAGSEVARDPEMGENALELEIYVGLGMTPMEAIQAATKNAAEAIWMDRDLGTLEAGKLADLVAVDGNPLEDIRVLQQRDRIQMVMKGGRVYVDRRPGHNVHAVHDQSRSWKRL